MKKHKIHGKKRKLHEKNTNFMEELQNYNDIKILGKPTDWGEIIIALNTKVQYFSAIKKRVGEKAKIMFDSGRDDFHIDLEKGPEEQEPEVLEKLVELLSK